MSEAEEAFAVVRDIRSIMDRTSVNERKRLDWIMEILDATDIGASGGRREASPVSSVADCQRCVGMQYQMHDLAEAFYPLHEAWICDPDSAATHTLMYRLEHVTRCCQEFPSRESLQGTTEPTSATVKEVAGSTPAVVSTVAGSQMPEGERGVDPANKRVTAEDSRKNDHYPSELALLKEARRRIRSIEIKPEHAYVLGLAIGELYAMCDELANVFSPSPNDVWTAEEIAHMKEHGAKLYEILGKPKVDPSNCTEPCRPFSGNGVPFYIHTYAPGCLLDATIPERQKSPEQPSCSGTEDSHHALNTTAEGVVAPEVTEPAPGHHASIGMGGGDDEGHHPPSLAPPKEHKRWCSLTRKSSPTCDCDYFEQQARGFGTGPRGTREVLVASPLPGEGAPVRETGEVDVAWERGDEERAARPGKVDAPKEGDVFYPKYPFGYGEKVTVKSVGEAVFFKWEDGPEDVYATDAFLDSLSRLVRSPGKEKRPVARTLGDTPLLFAIGDRVRLITKTSCLAPAGSVGVIRDILSTAEGSPVCCHVEKIVGPDDMKYPDVVVLATKLDIVPKSPPSAFGWWARYEHPQFRAWLASTLNERESWRFTEDNEVAYKFNSKAEAESAIVLWCQEQKDVRLDGGAWYAVEYRDEERVVPVKGVPEKPLEPKPIYAYVNGSTMGSHIAPCLNCGHKSAQDSATACRVTGGSCVVGPEGGAS